MSYRNLVEILRLLDKRRVDPDFHKSRFVLGSKGLALQVMDVDGVQVTFNVFRDDFDATPEQFVDGVLRLLDHRKERVFR